jgi:hypothetical protein
MCSATPNVCGFSVSSLVHANVNLLALRILRCIMDFWEIGAPKIPNVQICTLNMFDSREMVLFYGNAYECQVDNLK